MGADLYIKKLDREKQYLGFEVSQKAVDSGYFRDCYNDGGLFAHLGTATGEQFSWWAFDKNKAWFNKAHELNLTGQKSLLAKVVDARVYVKDKEYLKWTDLLIRFLETSIKLKSTIIWSV